MRLLQAHHGLDRHGHLLHRTRGPGHRSRPVRGRPTPRCSTSTSPTSATAGPRAAPTPGDCARTSSPRLLGQLSARRVAGGRRSASRGYAQLPSACGILDVEVLPDQQDPAAELLTGGGQQAPAVAPGEAPASVAPVVVPARPVDQPGPVATLETGERDSAHPSARPARARTTGSGRAVIRSSPAAASWRIRLRPRRRARPTGRGESSAHGPRLPDPAGHRLIVPLHGSSSGAFFDCLTRGTLFELTEALLCADATLTLGTLGIVPSRTEESSAPSAPAAGLSSPLPVASRLRMACGPGPAVRRHRYGPSLASWS